MKALSIKEPYAWDIITGDKTEEFRTWQPGNVSTFLMVSAGTPSPVDFGLGLPNGFALAVINIGHVEKPKPDGPYAWSVTVKELVQPFPVKGRLKFYDVDDSKIKVQPELTKSLLAYRQNEDAREADLFIRRYADPLTQIGYSQMPKKYQKILDQTGNWNAVAEAWVESARKSG